MTCWRTTVAMVVGCVFACASMPVAAVSPLPAGELANWCAEGASVADQGKCSAWVHGFLSGAYAGRIVQSEPAGTDKPDETFTERAARTRIARDRPAYGQNRSAGYCVPTASAVSDVVAALRQHAVQNPVLPAEANQWVLKVLRERYACRR